MPVPFMQAVKNKNHPHITFEMPSKLCVVCICGNCGDRTEIVAKGLDTYNCPNFLGRYAWFEKHAECRKEEE